MQISENAHGLLGVPFGNHPDTSASTGVTVFEETGTKPDLLVPTVTAQKASGREMGHRSKTAATTSPPKATSLNERSA